jgi:2-methylisocitrate lyase-like PEP mutase family enzyme
VKVTKELRDLLKKDEVLITLGAHDALSAKIIEKAGIQAIITAGFGISASYLGKPDAELYTMTENLATVRNMAFSVGIPIIADLDTGYGNAINVIRTVKEFERAGCAGGILEDQLAPKRCPACVNVVEIIPLDEAVGKIKAAVDAREDSDFLIVGRTDTSGSEAVDRANAYFEAGADMAMFISKAFPSMRELEKQSKNVKGPFGLNFFEGVHYQSWFRGEWKLEDLKKFGVKILNYPWVLLFAATQAMQEVAAHMARHQTIQGLENPARISHEDFIDLIGFPQIEALRMKYMRAPEAGEKVIGSERVRKSRNKKST